MKFGFHPWNPKKSPGKSRKCSELPSRAVSMGCAAGLRQDVLRQINQHIMGAAQENVELQDKAANGKVLAPQKLWQK
jgi:hypothetical protein